MNPLEVVPSRRHQQATGADSVDAAQHSEDKPQVLGNANITVSSVGKVDQDPLRQPMCEAWKAPSVWVFK